MNAKDLSLLYRSPLKNISVVIRFKNSDQEFSPQTRVEDGHVTNETIFLKFKDASLYYIDVHEIASITIRPWRDPSEET
ncbi:MAG: hypothetical protein WCO56_28495 [Verrucomicrobiota bacterium]